MATDPLRQRYEDEGHPYGTSDRGFDRWAEEVEERALSAGRDPRTQRPLPAEESEPEPQREIRPR